MAEIASTKVDIISRSDIVSRIRLACEHRSYLHVVTVNPEYIVDAQRNEKFRTVLNNADLSIIDGFGVIVALQYLSSKQSNTKSFFLRYLTFVALAIRMSFRFTIPKYDDVVIERMTGVDLIWQILSQDWMKGRRVYLLGGKDNVASAAVRRLRLFYPHIDFRFSNGHKNIREYSVDENKVILEDIHSFQPDILLVAYGHPYQDIWISDMKKSLDCFVAVGVGGSFDYISQRVKRAPMIIQKIGLEWLYRLYSNPSRISRIITATHRFISLVVR